MEDRIIDLIHNEKLIQSGDTLIVGVSGGPDSVALLHVLYRISQTISMKLIVAHLNHGFRGESAKQDALFVDQLAQELQLSSVIKEWSVKNYIKKQKVSPQQGARILRYRFYQLIAEQNKANKIALAHHKDDQTETVLLRLVRGTGPKGLAGIPICRKLGANLEIIRPLMPVSKQEIYEHLHHHGLGYRVDPTNAETYYLRNKVRHELIPFFEQMNSRFSDRLLETTRLLAEDNEYLEQEAHDIFVQSIIDYSEIPDFYLTSNPVMCLDYNSICDLTPAILRRVIFEGLWQLAENKAVRRDAYLTEISKHHVDKLLELVYRGDSGKVFTLPEGIQAFLDYWVIAGETRKVLALTIGKYEQKAYRMDLDLSEESYWPLTGWRFITQIRGHNFAGKGQSTNFLNNRKCYESKLDFDKLEFPLQIRNRRAGDKFTPLGMKSEKKLKDFFIDEKIPLAYRDKIPLIVDNREEIIWVVGYRINEHYKVTKDTDSALDLLVYEV